MTLSMFHAFWTGLMLAIFIGIVVWAYSGKRRQRFDAAARSPLEDEGDSLLIPLSPRGRGREGRGRPLIPTPSPARGEGGEPSARRATSFAREEN